MEICNETSTTKYEGGGGAKIEPPFTNVVSTCPDTSLGSFNTSKRSMDFSESSGKRSCISQEFEREQEEMKVQKVNLHNLSI